MTEAPESAAPAALIALAFAEVIRSWKRVVAYTLAAGVLSAAVVMILPERYESTFSIVPGTALSSAGSGGSSLLSAAQGLGFSGLASMLGSNPDLEYFDALLTSRTLAEEVVLHPLPPVAYDEDSSAANFLAVLGANSDNFEYGLAQGVRKFHRLVQARPDPASRVISVSVSAPTARLARAMGGITLEVLNSLNTRINQRSALGRLRSVRVQLGGASQKLHVAEDSLKDFYVANRTFSSSPRLIFEETRLKRAVDLAQSVYLLLNQQYEQAKLDASASLPSFAVVDAPSIPVRRVFPKRRVGVVEAMLVVAVATCGAVFGRAALAQRTPNSPQPLKIVVAAISHTGREVLGLYQRIVRRRPANA